MDEERYRIALLIAKAGFRRLGRSSIDGKEPHDVAMHGLHLEPWSPNVVWCDVIDAYRRERGRFGRRVVGIHDGYPARRRQDGHSLELDLAGPREVLLCELLAAGYLKEEAARVLGISPGRVSQIINRIRKRNAHVEARFQQRKESTDGP